jgi:adenylate cyclase class 2
MNKNIEIEIGFHLNNTSDVLQFLEKNAEPKCDQRQIDTYYNGAHHDFFENPSKVDEWLRVREHSGKPSICYKCWLPREAPKGRQTHCDEFETEVENADAVKRMFVALGFVPVAMLDKRRRSFMFKNVEVSIDQVAELGDFIELEYYGDEPDIDAARQKLYDTVKEIGANVGEQDHYGKIYLLMEKMGLIKKLKAKS